MKFGIKVAFFEVEDWGRKYLKRRGVRADGVKIYRDILTPDTAPLAEEVEAISVFIYSQVTAEIMDRIPNLRLITSRSTGYDHIDRKAAAERGITISNVPKYGETTVAEHAFGLILSLSRKIYQAYLRTVRLDFSMQGLRGFDLNGKTIGIVGVGAIGLHVIRIAKGFGMNVLAFDRTEQPLLAEVLGYKYVRLEELLAQSDIISLHVPLIPETHHMINDDAIKQMKRGVIIINTSRGAIIDTAALVNGLNDGTIAGAGLDVLEGEESIKEEAQLLAATLPVEKLRTVVQSYALLHRENVIITPHIAFYSNEAEARIYDTTIENIHSFVAGRSQNVVAPPSDSSPKK